MSHVVTVPELLDGHTVLDIECLDRIYLNGYVPLLQVGGQVMTFLHDHRGMPIASPAVGAGVLGEEGQHGPGALGPRGDVCFSSTGSRPQFMTAWKSRSKTASSALASPRRSSSCPGRPGTAAGDHARAGKSHR